MSKQPTKEQIELAEALQKREFCQDSKVWIIYHELLGFRIGRKPKKESNWEAIGPLPKASESWPEVRRSAEPGKTNSMVLSDVGEYMDDDLDTAMAQALLAVEGEG